MANHAGSSLSRTAFLEFEPWIVCLLRSSLVSGAKPLLDTVFLISENTVQHAYFASSRLVASLFSIKPVISLQ
jgi:hypothetical protein